MSSDSMIKFKEYLFKKRVKRIEKKLGKYRPDLLSSWHEQLEQKLEKEYQDEIEKLGDEKFAQSTRIKELERSQLILQGKYDEACKERDFYKSKSDKLIEKKTELRTKVIQLNTEVAEKTEQLEQIQDNPENMESEENENTEADAVSIEDTKDDKENKSVEPDFIELPIPEVFENSEKDNNQEMTQQEETQDFPEIEENKDEVAA